MEKIEAALAKARTARGTPAPAASPRKGPRPASGPLSGASSRLDAWQAVPEVFPDPAALAARRIVTPLGGRETAPFDVLRTKVMQQMRANNWRRLAITSPTAACGKSTITLNLGFSLARQPDIRTVIAELDLRRPSLAAMLGLAQGHSFARVLQGQGDLADNAARYGQNLIFATNQGPSRNPSELLQGAGVPDALSRIEADYDPDLMIFDMPPMLVSDDTMAFVGQVDCVLLIAAAEATTIREIDMCERDLAAQTNVLGVILNKCRHMGAEYGYGYYG